MQLEPITRGNDETISLSFTDSGGVALNLTGYTIWFTAKLKLSDTDASAIIFLSTPYAGGPGGITILDQTQPATKGKATVAIPATKTVALPNSDIRLYFDVKTKDPSGVIKSAVLDSSGATKGLLPVTPNVTLAT